MRQQARRRSHPQLDVPIAAFTGETGLTGQTTPFDSATLASLYPTNGAYVSAFDAATDRAVAAGFILPGDADQMKRDAAASSIGG